MSMSEKYNFYNSDGRLGASEKINVPGCEEMYSYMDDIFFNISKCFEETEVYVSTSKKYITASKKTINDLKSLATYAEVDLNTAEECVSETELRMLALKQEVLNM